MIQLYPIEVPGYLIPFIIREMGGVSVLYHSEEYTRINIGPASILGMFLHRRIKPDQRVRGYTMTIYSKKIGEKRAFSAEMMEFQTAAEFRVDLSFEEIEAFYKFLDAAFRSSFYFFVRGYCAASGSSKKIKEAIWAFIESYDLLEYGYNEKMLRHAYLKYRRAGGLHKYGHHERLSEYFFG